MALAGNMPTWQGGGAKARLLPAAAFAALAALAVGGQLLLASRRPQSPVLAEGAFAALGGLRSIAAEVIWFRADRLQEEGRYVEMAQLASALTFMEPHTPEVWSYAAWNLAYNVSVMMSTPEDRWRWVEAGLRLLRDEGLALNPDSPELCRELAWMFEIKIGADIDSAAAHYRVKWRETVEDVRARNAWDELRMDPAEMRRIESVTGFDDWTDPQLSAIYWGVRGRCADIVSQAVAIYRKHHAKADSQ
ncbi:MAG: hypothetical protein IKF72_05435 [Kiritimatiellae bacterium]|nr:hypothetical protein [Kiritimatiellia bacterium]